ncbi:MAG: hypothetical protein OXP75_13995, partial [Rhodospirillales bacterium]|nr:hypothetical protein [Rhodospirillales bacterium]
DRIEAALERLGDRVAARFGGLEARLAQASPLSDVGAEEEIESALMKMSARKFASTRPGSN